MYLCVDIYSEVKNTDAKILAYDVWKGNIMYEKTSFKKKEETSLEFALELISPVCPFCQRLKKVFHN